MTTIDIVPIGKPRMTRRDKWEKRECVTRYWQYKDSLQWLLKEAGVRNFPDSIKSITFVLPMPKSWSKAMRLQMDGMPHQQKPDIDNILKGFLDAVKKEDKTFHSIGAMSKVWGVKGQIKIEL